MNNPASSGARIFMTHDNKYLLKTIKKDELETFLRIIEPYYKILCDYKETFLMRIFGLYSHVVDGQLLIVIIMKNVLPPGGQMRNIYDLKGSTYNRTVRQFRHIRVTVAQMAFNHFCFCFRHHRKKKENHCQSSGITILPAILN